MAPIALRDKNGTLVTLAIVDADDYDRIARYNWSLRNGYARRLAMFGGKRRAVYMHREIVGATHGDGLQVEHRNGNKVDNRRANLLVRAVPRGSPAAPAAHAPAPGMAASAPDIGEPRR
jgi:hypothetical protein